MSAGEARITDSSLPPFQFTVDVKMGQTNEPSIKMNNFDDVLSGTSQDTKSRRQSAK